MSPQIGGLDLRTTAFAACLLCSMSNLTTAQVNIGIGLPSVSIGINIPVFPELVPVPGYPVYYGPRLDTNLFFYDGVYWVFAEDNWYTSVWYNGPWDSVAPEMVPDFLLRIPVIYYRRPPVYFFGWEREAPPRWGERWGHDWEERRRNWDHWDHRSVPQRAPLPLYQRRYPQDRYPRIEEQQTLRERDYHYRPREEEVRRRFEPAPGEHKHAPTPRRRPDVSKGSVPPRAQPEPRGPQRSNALSSPPQRRAEQKMPAQPARQPQPRKDSPPN